MLGAVRSITVVNSYYDGSVDKDVEVSTALSDVSVYFDRAGTNSDSGVAASDLVKIRIPYRDDYFSEDQWLSRRKQNKSSLDWTLRIGDTIIVDGKKKTILRFRDNTGRSFSPHWYVEAR